MKRGVVALLILLGACGGGSTSEEGTVEECFRDLAARYEQAANVNLELGPHLAAMTKGTRGMLEAAEARDTDALEESFGEWQAAADDVMALWDEFAREMDEAHELDADCP